MNYTVIIPARYASTRLPGKPLLPIHGKPLLQHVYEAAAASRAQQVWIATDDDRIASAARAFGAEVIMSRAACRSGTDRVAEAAQSRGLAADDIIVNVQGDEYGLPADLIDQVADTLCHSQADMATLCEASKVIEVLHDRNAVKVVRDAQDRALYFSRAALPWRATDTTAHCHRHIGLYALTMARLLHFTSLPSSPLEQSEGLEQLRALYHGWTIQVPLSHVACGTGIDTEGDWHQATGTPTDTH